MKCLSGMLSAMGLVLSLLSGLAPGVTPAMAQQPQQQPQQPAPSPGAVAAAREILAMKVGAAYANAVPTIVQRTKDVLLQSNLANQKDLDEVAVIVAQKMAGREKEIGEGMATIYASEFTEPELKELVVFFKSPIGQKLLSTEPRASQRSMEYMNRWAQNFADTVSGEFRAEMRKRGKPIQ